jgi:hypothetical protein
MALCCELAFWTGKDAAAIDRLFRQSGLIRDKWNERRRDTTYGAETIRRAIEATTEVYSGWATPAIEMVKVMVEPTASSRPSPYRFESAFAEDHFVSEWISSFSKQCDAALEFHEGAALTALAQATPNLQARVSGTAQGLRTNRMCSLLAILAGAERAQQRTTCWKS